MLEYPSLLLLPWSAAAPTAEQSREGPWPRRDILEPGSARPLGLVCPRCPPGPRWLRWARRPALEVRESEDCSLLLTLYRPWLYLRNLEVFDAEDHLVGTLRRSVIRDRFGRVLACAVAAAGGSSHRFVNLEGGEIGRLLPWGPGARLDFDSMLAANPFAKMLLLAAALALTETRRIAREPPTE